MRAKAAANHVEEGTTMFWDEEAETLPRAQLRALQLDRLRDTVAMVYERVPFFRESFDRAGVQPGDLQRLDDLQRFPFTRKSDLRDHYPFGLFARPLNEVVRIHGSSGTKGKPTVVGYTRRDIDT
jgi:phenylacetate-CoA ligase